MVEPVKGSDRLSQKLSTLRMEYEQVNDNFRMLADIRFKLLALVPPLGGVAVYVLSKIAGPQPAASGAAPQQPTPLDYSMAFLFGVMGFLVTLGITIYDQRNSELYNALIERAKYLETRLGLPAIKNPEHEFRGQFKERPGSRRYLFGFILMWHDRGLALIYGTVLGAWFFPMVYAGLELWNWWQVDLPVISPTPLTVALASASVMTLVFIAEFLRLDSKWKEFTWAKWLWPQSESDDSS